MPLPQGVLDFLYENAETEGAPRPGDDDDLFATGVIDSFSLVNFVAVVEEQCGIKVPDNDVNPGNFRSIAAVDHYVQTHKD